MEIPVTQQKTWTVLSMIEWGTSHLAERGFEDARVNVELLLCKVLQCERIDLYLKFDRVLREGELAAFKSLFKRRLSHEPIQYILGEAEFMGLRFTVDSRVLIPRPETEILVEHVVKVASTSPSRVMSILEIGTGSGNIAVSLAKFIPNCTIVSIDVSMEALEVARENVHRYEVEGRIELRRLDFLLQASDLSRDSYDVIVSNPPYVSKEDFSALDPEVRDFEPAIASTDNANGLTFHRAIAEHGLSLLRPGGWVFVEVAYNQSDIVQGIFRQQGYAEVGALLDYNRIERAITARRV